ncbi:MAG: hypothetical protein Kow00124_13690 [Anaerolineae bacterium]
MLMLLRWAIDLIFWLDILPLSGRYGWYLYHGGDQDLMLALARSILEGRPVPSPVAIGQPLMMLPWAALIRPSTYLDIVVPLTLINGFLFGGLSVALTGLIVLGITGNRRLAWWAAGLWAITPLAGYYALFWHPDYLNQRGVIVPKLAWMNGLADPPAAFFLLLSVALLARMLRDERQASFGQMVGVGAALSGAVIFRIHMAPVVAFLILYVLAAHSWRALLTIAGAGLLVYLPQALYNQLVFGIPFTSGYVTTNLFDAGYWQSMLRTLPFSPAHIVETAAYFLSERAWLIVPALAMAAAALLALIYVWRREGWQQAALLLGVPAAYLGPLLMSWPFREDVVRFSMPAIPFLIAIVCYTIWALWGEVQARRAGASHPEAAS